MTSWMLGGIGQTLHATDLFVLLADFETLPAAVLRRCSRTLPIPSPARPRWSANDGCAIVAPNPVLIAAAIDRAPARPRPLLLRNVAERYSIANGIASHEAALRDLIGHRPAQRTGW